MADFSSAMNIKTVLYYAGGAALASALAYGVYRVTLILTDDTTKNKDKTKKVLVLGLNGAGKSSILAALSSLDKSEPQEAREEVIPTQGFNIVSIEKDNKELNIWEIGGKENMRKYWDNFTKGTDVFIYVIDSEDVKRLDVACAELKTLVKSNPILKSVPFILVTNKQDLAESLSPSVILNKVKDTVPDITPILAATQVPPNASPNGISSLNKLLTKVLHA